jgi:elongation factor 1-alpha
MPWYKGPTLIETLDEKVIPTTLPLNKPLRGVVQDIYPYENDQAIVACKIETGTLTPQKDVVFSPSGKTAQLKKIMVFGSEVTRAEPGDSVGLILDDATDVERGEVLSYPQNQPQNVRNFVAEVILFAGLQIRTGDVLTIRCGTAEKKCEVTRILTEIDPVNLDICSKTPELLDNETVGEIEFSALEPVCIEKYSDFPELGRFVIEGKKGTVAAGIVLDVNS